jgi:hypothetical protein
MSLKMSLASSWYTVTKGAFNLTTKRKLQHSANGRSHELECRRRPTIYLDRVREADDARLLEAKRERAAPRKRI